MVVSGELSVDDDELMADNAWQSLMALLPEILLDSGEGSAWGLATPIYLGLRSMDNRMYTEYNLYTNKYLHICMYIFIFIYTYK